MSVDERIAKLIRINSEERISPTMTLSNSFTVNFGNSTQLMDINRIVVKQVSIPYVEYNIRAATVTHPAYNAFTFYDGATKTIIVPVGQYTIAQLIAAVNADGQAVADGLVLAQNAITQKITFTSTAPITFLSATNGNGMASKLGITANSGALVTSFAAQGLTDMSIHPNIYIASSALSDGSSMISPTLGSLPIFAVIPINQPFGTILQYAPTQEHLDDIHYISYANGKSLQSIDLSVYDGDGQLIDMQGLDWTIVIRAYQAPL